MAIGGPMWQKSQASRSQGLGYGQQMRENFVENRRAQIQALGSQLFSTNINAGSGMVELSFKLASARMQAEYAEKRESINSSILSGGLGDKIDLLA